MNAPDQVARDEDADPALTGWRWYLFIIWFGVVVLLLIFSTTFAFFTRTVLITRLSLWFSCICAGLGVAISLPFASELLKGELIKKTILHRNWGSGSSYGFPCYCFLLGWKGRV